MTGALTFVLAHDRLHFFVLGNLLVDDHLLHVDVHLLRLLVERQRQLTHHAEVGSALEHLRPVDLQQHSSIICAQLVRIVDVLYRFTVVIMVMSTQHQIDLLHFLRQLPVVRPAHVRQRDDVINTLQSKPMRPEFSRRALRIHDYGICTQTHVHVLRHHSHICNLCALPHLFSQAIFSKPSITAYRQHSMCLNLSAHVRSH